MCAFTPAWTPKATTEERKEAMDALIKHDMLTDDEHRHRLTYYYYYYYYFYYYFYYY